MRPEDISGLEGLTIILDIDGTVVPSGSEDVQPGVREAIEELKRKNDVYAVSNSFFGDRKRRIASSLGLRLAEGVGRKPDPRILGRLGADPARPVAVVGDRWTTDGLLAKFAGGRFVKVRRLTCATDPFLDRAICFVDDASFAMRPYQYVKNLLIFAPIIFADAVFDTHKLLRVVFAFLSFCLAASAGYVVNDVIDRADDATHETKRHRPIAAGTISPTAAFVLAAILLVASALAAPDAVTRTLILIYVSASVAYSVWLKKVPVLELVLFGVFYVFRVVVGGTAADVPVSSWLILCTFFVAMLMITAKRHAERAAGRNRSVLAAYAQPFLDTVLAVAAALALVTYGLYSILGTNRPLAVWSNIPVVFGVLRYLQLAHGGTKLEYPEKAVMTDPWLLGTTVAWLSFMIFIFYRG